MFKNPNWREADQLVIYKHDRGVELGSTDKQLQLSGHSGTSTCHLWISSYFDKLFWFTWSSKISLFEKEQEENVLIGW